jgi:hypothetical protein
MTCFSCLCLSEKSLSNTTINDPVTLAGITDETKDLNIINGVATTFRERYNMIGNKIGCIAIATSQALMVTKV